MREFLAKPGFLGSNATIGADLSFLLAILFTALFLVGWRWARKRQGNRHHFIVLSAGLAMIGYFTFYYLIRELGILAIEGREGFGGPYWFYTYIFSPVLVAHIILVVIGLVMVVYMVVLGFRVSRKDNGQRHLAGGDLKASNRTFFGTLTAIVAVLILLAFVRCQTLRCSLVYGAGALIVASVFFLERIIERLIPDGRKRHIYLGRFVMVVFFVVLITATMTYFSLYVLYHPRLT